MKLIIIKNFEEKIPSQCDSQEQFFELLENYIRKFKEKIQSKKESLLCKEDGKPEENLMKNNIQLEIIQFNSDNISILEDITPFNILLKLKIKEILSDFEPTINNIFDIMMETIKPIIKECLGDL